MLTTLSCIRLHSSIELLAPRGYLGHVGVFTFKAVDGVFRDILGHTFKYIPEGQFWFY